MKHFKLLPLLVLTAFFGTALADTSPDGTISTLLKLPQRLQPYANEEEVRANLNKVVDIISTVTFKDDGASESEDQCKTPEVNSFYRGMQLSHAAFYFFVSLQELGWPRYSNPGGNEYRTGKSEPEMAFVGPARAVLLKWANIEVLLRIALGQDFRLLPPDHKHDIATFLKVLLRFNKHEAKLQIAQDELAEIQRRSSEAYSFEITNYGKVKTEDLSDTVKPLDYWHAVGELINKVDPLESEKASECYDRRSGISFRYGRETVVSESGYLLPTKYMVTFWRRRRAEGLDDIAAYVIGKLITKFEN